MSPQPFDLPALQCWMQTVMMDAASTQPDGILRVEEVITASRQQTSRQRLDVYCNAYQARLLECLREEFATLCQFLEQDIFDGLAVAYLEAHPSNSYTLANLGARFPRFLRDFAETHEDSFEGARFLIDLATLERLYAEVFDGPGIEGLPLITPDDLRNLSSQTLPSISLKPAPSLRLVEFAYPVHEYVTACRHGTEPPVPEPCQTWLAVTRRQYVVRRVSLTEQQYSLLKLLADQLPLGEALERVAQSCGDIESFTRDIEIWFRDWTAAGFFQAIRHPIP